MPAQNTASSGEPLGVEMAEQAEAAVITPAMLKEEEQLEAAGLEKERQMLEKARASWDRESSEMRYKRLQHLLEKSNIYSKFLLTKMEQQQLEEQRRKEKLERKREMMLKSAKGQSAVDGKEEKPGTVLDIASCQLQVFLVSLMFD
uniref:Uncharacterized protein n=1 Tax=Amazona collaria TaxID=241587 RepID=A0A8B9F909_9PSIT